MKIDDLEFDENSDDLPLFMKIYLETMLKGKLQKLLLVPVSRKQNPPVKFFTDFDSFLVQYSNDVVFNEEHYI